MNARTKLEPMNPAPPVIRIDSMGRVRSKFFKSLGGANRAPTPSRLRTALAMVYRMVSGGSELIGRRRSRRAGTRATHQITRDGALECQNRTTTTDSNGGLPFHSGTRANDNGARIRSTADIADARIRNGRVQSTPTP